MNFKAEWHEAYAAYVTKYGKKPKDVASLGIGSSPAPASWLELEQDIFLRTFEETVEILTTEPIFQEYNAREQVLAVWYTWLEQWQEQRPVLGYLYRTRPLVPIGEDFMTTTRVPFQEWMARVVRRGIATQEIAERWGISDAYVPVMWQQARLFFYTYFSQRGGDSSRTDALIEKSANFLLDLFQPNALDSGFDLVRFLFQAPPKDNKHP